MVFISFLFGREEGQKDVLADSGSGKAGWADLATVDADEETLDFRVGRIEENPRVAFNSVIKKNGETSI